VFLLIPRCMLAAQASQERIDEEKIVLGIFFTLLSIS
jgi:hypothetical protein